MKMARKKITLVLVAMIMAFSIILSGCSKEITSVPADYRGMYKYNIMYINIKSTSAVFNMFYIDVPYGTGRLKGNISGTFNMVRGTVNDNKATLTYSIKLNNVLKNVSLTGTAQAGKSFYAYGYTYKKQ